MKSFLLTLSAVGLLLNPLHAAEYKIPKEQPVFSIDFPAGWTVTHEDESIDGVSKDESLQVYAQTDDSSTLEDSIKSTIDYLLKAGVKLKDDTKKVTDGEINGLKASTIYWNGTDKDGDCLISLTFIPLSEKEVITLLYWGSEKAEKEHGEELKGIVKSMKVLAQASEKDEKKDSKEEAEEK